MHELKFKKEFSWKGTDCFYNRQRSILSLSLLQNHICCCAIFIIQQPFLQNVPLKNTQNYMSLSDDKQADIIDAFNNTSRYLDDILNINNVYFGNMVSRIYPSELQLNKANTSDTEATF